MIDRFDVSKYSMSSLFELLEDSKAKQIRLKIANPNILNGDYAGKQDDGLYYRSWRSWIDIATLFYFRLKIEAIDEKFAYIVLDRLQDKSFHTDIVEDKREKYGKDSQFYQIDKFEEPIFYYHYRKALESVYIKRRQKILSLGANRADELRVISDFASNEYQNMHFTIVEYSQSALEDAKINMSGSSSKFICDDISNIKNMDLGRFDMLISIGTLQSPDINMKKVMMHIVTELLERDSAIVLGFPNSRWIDGELIYGARVPNYNFSELSSVIKDIYWLKKYLQQHKYRVMITGREYLFLSAVSIVR